MALVHKAELRPTKVELLAKWLPTRSWYDGVSDAEIVRVASYRFDDPAGEVGVETMLVTANGGRIMQVPLTYRAAPLLGSDQHLVGTCDHSVLGKRWIYDGCADPVYVGTLAQAILTGGRQADEVIEIDGEMQRRDPSAVVRGTGNFSAPTIDAAERYDDGEAAVILAGRHEFVIPRTVPSEVPASGALALTGRWPGQDSDVVLVAMRAR